MRMQVFESMHQPQLCVAVRRNGNLSTSDENMQSPQLAQFSMTMRYWTNRTYSGRFEWTKMSMFMVYRQFAHFFGYIKRIKTHEIRCDAKGMMDYGPPSAVTIGDMVCTITRDCGTSGTELFLNRPHSKPLHSFKVHSIRVGGRAYTCLFELLERVMVHVHEQCGLPFSTGINIHATGSG